MISTVSIILSIATFLGMIIVSIISYFLKKTMSDLEKTKEIAILVRKDLDVLTKDHDNKHEYLTEKFDDLKDSIVVLTKEIKELTAKIK